MDGHGSGLSGRSPRIEGRMPGHRISRAFVLHRDVVPTATLVTRGPSASADHGIRAARRRLPPQTAGRLHPHLTVRTRGDAKAQGPSIVKALLRSHFSPPQGRLSCGTGEAILLGIVGKGTA